MQVAKAVGNLEGRLAVVALYSTTSNTVISPT